MKLQIKKIQEILAARRTILASNSNNITLSAKELDLLKQQSNEITKRILQLAKDKGLKEEDIEKIKARLATGSPASSNATVSLHAALQNCANTLFTS